MKTRPRGFSADIATCLNAADWSKTTAQISRETGIAYTTVYLFRRRALKQDAIQMNARNSPEHIAAAQARREKWESFDWEKRDIELSMEHGLTRERIRQIRELLGVRKHLGRAGVPLEQINWNLPTALLATIWGRSVCCLKKKRRQLQLEKKEPRFNRELVAREEVCAAILKEIHKAQAFREEPS